MKEKRSGVLLAAAVAAVISVHPLELSAQEQTEQINVFGQSRTEYEWSQTVIKNDSAEIRLESGYSFQVDHCPQEAHTFCVFEIPESHQEARGWIGKQLNMDNLQAVFQIWFRDKQGNWISPEQSQMTITNCSEQAEIYSLSSAEMMTILRSDGKPGSLTFTADKSNLYLLVKPENTISNPAKKTPSVSATGTGYVERISGLITTAVLSMGVLKRIKLKSGH